MAVRHYKRTALTGVAGSLDELAIDVANGPITQYYNLGEGDTARVDFSSDHPTYPNTSMDYIFDADGIDATSSPKIIHPVDFTTAGVWRLVKMRILSLAVDTIELLDATQGVVMTPTERARLAAMEDSANNYVHPAGHDAAIITTGTIDLARLPQGALEVLVHVADEAARYALTTNDVQTGDTVQQDDTGEMFRVIDDTNLNNSSGYAVFTAGVASSAPWTGITGKPATYPATAHDLSGADHNDTTLAALNAKITDATLIDTADPRLSDDRYPTSHGNEIHDAVFITATEAPVQSVAGRTGDVVLTPADAGAEPSFMKNTAFNKNFGAVADSVCEGDDSRLSDDRYPTSHAASHVTGGADEIAVAVADTAAGLMSAADKAKLDGISTGAVASVDWDEVVNRPVEDQLLANLIDTSEWVYGGTGDQGNFVSVGGAAANSIVIGEGPDGVVSNLWKCTPQDATTDDGGWNDYRIGIDNTRTYRFAAYVKRTTAADGTVDFGLLENAGSDPSWEVKTAGGSTLVTVPLFKSAYNLPELHKWYLMVGYVLPAAYAGAQMNYGGVYDCVTGERIASCTDYQWGASATQIGHKTIYTNSTDSSTALVYLYAPRIDMISGMEAALKSLILKGSAKVWTDANDGAGSGLDAGLLGGQLPSAYATLAGAQVFTGAKTFATSPILNNSIALSAKESGGTQRSLAQIGGSNIAVFGDTAIAVRLNSLSDPTYYNGTSTYTLYHTGNAANLAKLDGTQTFSGVNTFSSNMYLSKTAPNFRLTNTDDNIFMSSIVSGGRCLLAISDTGATGGGDLLICGSSALTNVKSLKVRYASGDQDIYHKGNDANLAKLDAANIFTDEQVIRVSAVGGASVNTNADDLLLENNSGYCGLSIKTSNAGVGQILFSDSDSNAQGIFQYRHSDDRFRLAVNNGTHDITLEADGTFAVDGNTVYHTGNDDNLSKKYTGTVIIPDTSTYQTVATVNGGAGASSGIKLFIQGTQLNVVVDVSADILASTSGDIVIESTATAYTQIYIQVVSNGGNDYDIKLRGTSQINNLSCTLDIYPLSDETVTFTTTSTHSTTTNTHLTQHASRNITAIGGTAAYKVEGNTVYHTGNDSNLAKLDAANILTGGSQRINTTAPSIILNETDTSTAGRMVVTGGGVYIQAGATGSGEASGSGDLSFQGFLGANLNSLTARFDGVNQNIYHTGNAATDLVDLTSAQTISGLKNFSANNNYTANQRLANNVYIQGKRVDTSNLSILGIDGSDNCNIGTTGAPSIIKSSVTPKYYDGTNTYTLYHTGNDSTLQKILTKTGTASDSVEFSPFTYTLSNIASVTYIKIYLTVKEQTGHYAYQTNEYAFAFHRGPSGTLAASDISTLNTIVKQWANYTITVNVATTVLSDTQGTFDLTFTSGGAIGWSSCEYTIKTEILSTDNASVVAN